MATQKSFHKQESNLEFVLMHTSAQLIKKLLLQVLRKPPLENVARTFGTFEKQQSKNEIGQVATNVTTA